MKGKHKAITHAEPLQCKETGIDFDSSQSSYILIYWDKQGCNLYEH